MLSDDDVAEQLAWLHLDRWRIEPQPVVDVDDDEYQELSGKRLVPVTTLARAEIAEYFARCFGLDAGFDGLQFDVDAWRRHDPEWARTFLVNSQSFLALVPISIGALGVRRVQDSWLLSWVWLHPFERQTCEDSWASAWRELEGLLPGLGIEAPLTAAMRGWVKKESIEDRVFEVRPGA